MLILTRNPSEKIIINENIKIEVLAIHGSQVRLGLEAPSHISIHREEIFNRIQEEQQQLLKLK